MEARNFTREELAKYILHSAKDTVIAKIKAVLENEDAEDIVAYTTGGIPLNAKDYVKKNKKGMNDIESGNSITQSDLEKEINNW